MTDQHLTTAEVAAHLRVHPRTVARLMIDAGKAEIEPAWVTVGRVVRWRLGEVDRWLDEVTAWRSGRPIAKTMPAQVPPLEYDDPRVYFIDGAGAVKIGFTTQLATRLASLQTSTPTPLKLLAHLPGEIQDESNLHHAFRDARLNGEWFKKTIQLLCFIASAVERAERGEDWREAIP